MVALAATAVVSGCVGAGGSPWETLPGETRGEPQVFFPGQVSDPATQQWAFSFTPDGRQLFYATDAPRRIMTQSWLGRRWTAPESLDDPNTDRDGGPFVTPSGDYLYFSSWRDGKSLDLYRRSLRPLRDAERVTFTDGYGEVSLSLDRAGNGFLWSSGRADGSRGLGFYRVLSAGGRLQLIADASNLHTGDSSGENSPYVDRLGRFVLFANYDIGGETREDLFISVIKAGRLEPPVALGDVVNSPFNDTSPWMTPDGNFLLFSSDRPAGDAHQAGDYQIWWVPVAAVPALSQALRR